MKKSDWAILISILALFVLWVERWAREDGTQDLQPVWALQGDNDSLSFTSYRIPKLPPRPEVSTCQPQEPLCTYR